MNDYPPAHPDVAETITSGPRSRVVDIVKGIAIILVAYGHTTQGMVHRGWWLGRGPLFSNDFIYSFHMPAFFFTAGLFVINSIDRRGRRQFTREKLKTILYPYILFVVIDSLIEPLVGRFKFATAPFHWKFFWVHIIDGEASWFLFTLFACLMLALLTARVPAWLRFMIATFLGILPSFGPPLTNQVLHEFPFLAAGMWIGAGIYRLEQIPTATASVWLVIFALGQFLAIYYYGPPTHWTYIELGLAGTTGLLLLAQLLDRFRLGRGLAWVGRASLSVFLLSPFMQGATREILSRGFHTRELWLQLLLPTAFATVLPAVAWHQQKQWRISWLFRWPLS